MFYGNSLLSGDCDDGPKGLFNLRGLVGRLLQTLILSPLKETNLKLFISLVISRCKKELLKTLKLSLTLAFLVQLDFFRQICTFFCVFWHFDSANEKAAV